MQRTNEPMDLAAWRRGHYFLIILLLTSFYFAFRIIQPYLHAMVVAGILATVFYPVYAWIRRKVGGRENWAAILSCLLVALVVVVPLTVFSVVLVQKGLTSFKAIQDWVQSGKIQQALASEQIQTWLHDPRIEQVLAWKNHYFPTLTLKELDLTSRLVSGTKMVVTYFGGQVLPMLNNVFSLLMNFLLMLFCMFYFFRDGERVIAWLLRICPLPDVYEKKVLERIKVVSKSAILGTVLTAVAQGMLAMIAFAVVGIGWFFWGVVLGFASLIPLVGTALIWVPCVLYLFIIGKVWSAIGLAVYCVLVVGSADNLLRPILMQGDTGLSSMLLFFSLIGGIQLFGLLGVIYGPLIFGITAMLLYIYGLETGVEDEGEAGIDTELNKQDADSDAPLLGPLPIEE